MSSRVCSFCVWSYACVMVLSCFACLIWMCLYFCCLIEIQPQWWIITVCVYRSRFTLICIRCRRQVFIRIRTRFVPLPCFRCSLFIKGVGSIVFCCLSLHPLSAWGPKTQLENDLLRWQIEIWVQNRCYWMRLGMLEDCSVTGSDFLRERLRKFSIFTVLPYRRFSVWGPKTQLENDILRRQIEIWA